MNRFSVKNLYVQICMLLASLNFVCCAPKPSNINVTHGAQTAELEQDLPNVQELLEPRLNNTIPKSLLAFEGRPKQNKIIAQDFGERDVKAATPSNGALYVHRLPFIQTDKLIESLSGTFNPWVGLEQSKQLNISQIVLKAALQDAGFVLSLSQLSDSQSDQIMVHLFEVNTGQILHESHVPFKTQKQLANDLVAILNTKDLKTLAFDPFKSLEQLAKQNHCLEFNHLLDHSIAKLDEKQRVGLLTYIEACNTKNVILTKSSKHKAASFSFTNLNADKKSIWIDALSSGTLLDFNNEQNIDLNVIHVDYQESTNQARVVFQYQVDSEFFKHMLLSNFNSKQFMQTLASQVLSYVQMVSKKQTFEKNIQISLINHLSYLLEVKVKGKVPSPNIEYTQGKLDEFFDVF